MKRFSQKNISGFILLVIGAVFVCIGILHGEPLQVMQKAVKICLECIGIG